MDMGYKMIWVCLKMMYTPENDINTMQNQDGKWYVLVTSRFS